jgi:hypothetical protein
MKTHTTYTKNATKATIETASIASKVSRHGPARSASRARVRDGLSSQAVDVVFHRHAAVSPPALPPSASWAGATVVQAVSVVALAQCSLLRQSDVFRAPANHWRPEWQRNEQQQDAERYHQVQASQEARALRLAIVEAVEPVC